MKNVCKTLFLFLLLITPVMLSAQDAMTVPDVKGLNVPQAAAALNRAGLRLGAQLTVGWTALSGVPQDSIGQQSIEAGTTTAPGSTVDVTLLRSPNIALVYDDNDLTLVNLTPGSLDIRNLTFASKEGTPASFEAVSWRGVFAPQGCGQIWSVQRGSPKEITGCDVGIMNWLSTTKTPVHFWTQVNGVTRFSIVDNGVERGVCDAAPVGSQDAPLRCEAFVSGSAASDDSTPYVYFAYTPEAFVFFNKSSDKWMPTAQTTILNNNPSISIAGAPVAIGDPNLFGNPATVGNIRQLAPNQCLFLTSDNPNATPPEPCDPIARLDLTSAVAFWLADFQIQGSSDGQNHQCPAAVPDKIIICVLPR